MKIPGFKLNSFFKTLAYSVLTSGLALLAACSSTTDPSEAYKGESAQQIFQGGEDALRDKGYSDAIKRFEALDVQYPFGRNTETAQLHIIYAYYKNSDYLSAETAADRFIHAYPSSPNVDYAYYLRGLATYYQNMGVFERLFAVDFATRDLTQVKKSFTDFSELETRFPESPYAPAAHQYMIYLRNVLASHQVEVALFYFNRQAYVAAANRASMVVEHYQGAPVVPDALVIMAKSYHQLRQTDLENQAVHVIQFNYPNSVYIQQVTGPALDDARYSLLAKQNREIPPPQQAIAAPPTVAQVAANYHSHSNGVRGGTTSVADLVKEIRSSKIFASHAPDMPTTNTPERPTQQMRSSSNQNTNITRNSSSVTLGDVWKKLSMSNFFSTHSKPSGDGQSDAIESTPAGQPVAQNETQEAPMGNGDRR